MKFKKIAAMTAAAAVLAVAAPVTGITAMAEESTVSVVRSLNGVIFDGKDSKENRRDLKEAPDNSKSYTYKVDITGSIPAEGYKVDLRTFLFYNEEYTCDIKWTCGGKLQYDLPNRMLFMVNDYECQGDTYWGMGGGGEDPIIPSDCTEKSYSFSGDIVLEEGNFDHSSEQYQAYLAEYNSEWYQSTIKDFENMMNDSEVDSDYREYCREKYESFKEIREYPYSWYKLGSDKKSVTLELGKAPDPVIDHYGLVKPELRDPMISEEMVNETKNDTKMVVSDGPYFNFTVTTPGTIELTFKAKGADTKPTEPTVPTKQQSFHDDKTDISVDGSFPEGTSLKTETKQTSDTKVSWDITPVDANGNKVQPSGTATVKVPLPDSFKGKDVFVYRVESGKYTALESTVEGNYIVFKTSHFSEYMLTTEEIQASNPSTGSTAVGTFTVLALAGAFIVISRKKR